jgi:hypothetical protein
VNLPEEPYSLRLADLTGKTVWEGRGQGKSMFDLKAVKPNGVYFLTLIRKQGQFTQKLLLGN